jgi:hypothetical protein
VLKRRGFALPTLLILAVPVAALTLAATALMISSQCSTSAPTATPTSTASKAIPPQLLTIYEQVGSQYNLPWQILAGIGQEECDQGRDPDPSCTPQPGATGPGTANFAGASGPMQIGIGDAAGDEYDSPRRYLPNPSLGPHDPTTAVQLAALVLIKDKGARPASHSTATTTTCAPTTAQARWPGRRVRRRVLTDAQSYGTGAAITGGTCGPTTNTPIVAGEKAKILAGGDAAAPQQAPVAVRAMIAAGNRINHFDYKWGGGHANPSLSDNQTNPQPQGGERPGDNGTPGYDCSGATDYVLYGLAGSETSSATVTQPREH